MNEALVEFFPTNLHEIWHQQQKDNSRMYILFKVFYSEI